LNREILQTLCATQLKR